MKTRIFISLLVLFVFGLCGFIVDKDEFTANMPILILIAVAFFLLVLIFSLHQEAEKEKEKEKLELHKKEELLKFQKSEKYKALRKEFIDANGVPDKTIVIREHDLNSEIHVYERSKRIFIEGRMYYFRDIISCTLSDNPQVIKGKVTSTTKSKNGSVIGRSIVGDLVAGPAGAIIGGTTAKKQTEYFQENDKIIHSYTAIINVNSISRPIIQLHAGEDGVLANEIAGLMNVIISRK